MNTRVEGSGSAALRDMGHGIPACLVNPSPSLLKMELGRPVIKVTTTMRLFGMAVVWLAQSKPIVHNVRTI